MVAQGMDSVRILTDSLRLVVVEMMVQTAIGDYWRPVSEAGSPWDLQFGVGGKRVRICVRQCAALEPWGAISSPTLFFGRKRPVPPSLASDMPTDRLEVEGSSCDLLVVGVHLETEPELANHGDVRQWQFLIIPASDLEPGRDSMPLNDALKRWDAVPWEGLREAVEEALGRHGC